ncbi:dipeptidyl aminopeptidase/acylaminoacyl peptidase [Caulobacter sp. AP07]|uniref:S9 family peptidase n=1 Tax=Caulobacter sp. AP07 TaxID=1144304 RepID=UPI00027201C8|nr:S9 family peptidase [Caulobacter sp. AP07]EJL27628.1 dipeptidyl aminopeptidase/acylaminoacyl peptidase [Caulobacter sp. AP07]
MLKLFAGAAMAALACVGAASAGSLDAYGRLPAISDVEISSDGANLAYIAHDGGTSRVIIQPLNGGEIQSVDFGKVKMRGVSWPDPGHVLAEVSRTAAIEDVTYVGEQFQATSINVKTGAQVQIPKRSYETINNVLSSDPVGGVVNGKPTIFTQFYAGEEAESRQAGRFDLYRVDPDTGIAAMVQMGDFKTGDYLFKTDGTVIARTRYDRENARWSMELRKDGKWVDAYVVTATVDGPDMEGLSLDEKSVVMSIRDEKTGGYQLANISIADGKLGEFYGPNGPFDVVMDDANHVVGTVTNAGYKQYQFDEPRLAAAWSMIAGVFPGRQLALQSHTPDYSKIVIYVEGTGEPGGYYLLDLAAKKLSKVGSAYPALSPADVAEVRAIKYSAADGLTIQGYLTLPPGKAAKNLPLIVMPHGGPESRDEAGFDWWAQALASRGYAVLQPNFRGSTGYGESFIRAGDGEWGGKMQTDLSDGVRFLAKQGVVDPKRVCITGASYGGYAALAGITLDKGVYRCAVSVAGIGDVREMINFKMLRYKEESPTIRYYKRIFGVTSTSDPKLDARSPARHAAEADGPVLLIHGKDDTVVQYSQSTDMRNALERAKKPVEFVNLGAEDHWLSREATRQQMLAATVAFLEKNNPPN